MSNADKESCRICIEQTYHTLAINTERTHNTYFPSTGAKGGAAKHIISKKPTSKIKLKFKPQKVRHRKKKSYPDACLALCNFPDYTEDAKTAATLLLLVLLSQISYLLVGVIPSMPVIVLNTAFQAVLPVLSALFHAVQGPELWKGQGRKLRRPWLVLPQLALGETKPSTAILDYIGGKITEYDGKHRRFCFPFVCSTAAFSPNLPLSTMKQIMAFSPLAIPIVFDRRGKDSERPSLEMKGDRLISYDAEKIMGLDSYAQVCHLEIMDFLNWFCRKKKHIKRWKEDFARFRPVSRNGRFYEIKSDENTEYLCAALALFRQYLLYASEKNNWITSEDAQKIMSYYWQLVLPESAPQENKGESGPAATPYDSPETFYRFLAERFLPIYRSQVLSGKAGVPGTMALVRTQDGVDIFITPRKVFLDAYAQWLAEHHAPVFDLSTSKGEAAVQRQLSEAGIPLRGEKNNPSTYRYPFYGKAGDKVNCFVLPINQLPESVQSVFGELLGKGSDAIGASNHSESVPNSGKGAKSL